MLLEAKDRYKYTIDVVCRLKPDGIEEEREEIKAALFGESVLHKGGLIKDDGL